MISYLVSKTNKRDINQYLLNQKENNKPKEKGKRGYDWLHEEKEAWEARIDYPTPSFLTRHSYNNHNTTEVKVESSKTKKKIPLNILLEI